MRTLKKAARRKKGRGGRRGNNGVSKEMKMRRQGVE
jgi:hypothetical protein